MNSTQFVWVFFLTECQFLGEGYGESLAHLLASVHLKLRQREGLFATNTDYQYYVERYMCVHVGEESIGFINLSVTKVSCTLI